MTNIEILPAADRTDKFCHILCGGFFVSNDKAYLKLSDGSHNNAWSLSEDAWLTFHGQDNIVPAKAVKLIVII